MYDYDYSSLVIIHSGIKGQKWGQRRYQNSDGSLTPAGRERYGVGKARTSMVAKVKLAVSNAKKEIKKTSKEVKKAFDKQKAKKLKKEQDEKKAEREGWLKDKKSIYKHFGEMSTEERVKALESMQQFDELARYKNQDTKRNIELVGKGLKAIGVSNFNDLMQGSRTAFNLIKDVRKDKENREKQAASEANKLAKEEKELKAKKKLEEGVQKVSYKLTGDYDKDSKGMMEYYQSKGIAKGNIDAVIKGVASAGSNQNNKAYEERLKNPLKDSWDNNYVSSNAMLNIINETLARNLYDRESGKRFDKPRNSGPAPSVQDFVDKGRDLVDKTIIKVSEAGSKRKKKKNKK